MKPSDKIKQIAIEMHFRTTGEEVKSGEVTVREIIKAILEYLDGK